jgi:hypothetical protein
MNTPRHKALAQQVEKQLDFLEYGEGQSLSPFEKAQLIKGLFPQLEDAVNSVEFTQCKNPGKAEALIKQLQTTLTTLSQGTWVIDEDSATYDLLVIDEIDHLLFD